MPRPNPDFFSHLEELRWRLIICLAVFMTASTAAYFYSSQLIDFLTLPLRQAGDVQLFFQKPYEAFLTHLKAAVLAGVILSSPVLILQAWLFIAPGLYGKEKKALLWITLSSLILFLTGVVFGYCVVIPWGLHFLLEFQTTSMKPLLGVDPYFSFVVGMILAFGVLFDFPVIIIGLVRLGLTSTRTLAKVRKTIIACIFIAAAILTPSPDPLSQLMLAGPLILLFEVSLLVARAIEKRKALH